MGIDKGTIDEVPRVYTYDFKKAKVKNDTIEFESTDGTCAERSRTILKDKRLTAGEKVLYLLLLWYGWRGGGYFPGRDVIARDMDCHEGVVILGLERLIELKLIKVKRRDGVDTYVIRRLKGD